MKRSIQTRETACGFSLVACCLLFVLGCSAHTETPHAPTIADVRATAAKRPKDANAQRELALGEAFMRGGDPARVEAALTRARTLDAKSPELALVAALLDDVHGHPAQALEGYLAALDLAAASTSPVRSALIEAGSYAVLGLDGNAPGFVAKVRPRLLALLGRNDLPLPARAALVDALSPLVLRAGAPAESARLATSIGCLTELRVAGPFGPRELLGFDAPPASVDPAMTLADRYDLGPGRGVRATRNAHARICTLHLGGGPVTEGGTTFAQRSVTVASAGNYTLRVDSPNSVDVFIDGKSVLRVDRRSRLSARAVFVTLPLTAGAHLVTAQLTTRHPNPALELSLVPSVAGDADAIPLPYATTRPRDGFGLYLRAMIALLRGDVLGARQMLAEPASFPDASPLVLLQRSGTALGDPLVPDDVRQDEGRRYLAQAFARDHGLWAPATQLATLAAKSGRVKESIGALREASKRWPEVPTIGFALIELLRSKSLDAEVDREIARLRERVPDACPPLAAELDSLHARKRAPEAEALAQKLVACDAQNNALFSTYLERRDWDAAQRELARLSSLDPEESRYAWLLAGLSLAKNRGAEADVTSLIGQLRTRYPRSYTGALEQIDEQAGAGQAGEALKSLSAALSAEPSSMAMLHRLAPIFGGEHVLEKYRKSGKAAVEAFQKSGRSYDGPQVLVLDYLALRIFADGSSLQLVQSVTKTQSDEAVNQLAEVDVPEGAQLLTLRAYKPDGTRLEADDIAGKDSVSLPSVAPGDFVELEYLQAAAAPEGFPRGYLGDRFYFKSYEVPFDHSEMVVILPKDMPYQIDPRGDAPKVEERMDGDQRVLDFHVDQSVALVAEPSSVSIREFIPSVRIGVNATYDAMLDSLRDMLADRDLYDPYYAALARKIVGEAAANDYRLRAERLYAWVLENVENSDDVFAQAALMLRAHSGNRARVLHYLLGLAGVPSDLALVRNFVGDQTPSTMADAETYSHLLVRVAPNPPAKGDKGVQAPIWLFTVERWAPFGFMPSALRSQEALMLVAGNERARVSEGLLGADHHDVSLDIELRADGSARVECSETMHGAEAVSWREQLEQIPGAELDRKFEQDYVSRLFPGAALSKLEITGREQGSPDLVLRYVIDLASFGRKVGGGLALPPLLTSDLSSTFARVSTRKTTELVPSPVDNHLVARLKLPAGAALPVIPGSVNVSAALAARPSFQESHALKDGVLVLDRTLRLPALRVTPAQYPAFAEFCRRVDQAEARELMVRVK